GAASRRARPGGDPRARAARLLSAAAELDPGIARVLEGMLAFAGPPAHEVPVDQARAGHEAETRELSGEGEQVASVEDRELPGPGGPIPVRIYRPEGEPPLGVVTYLHGGGWMVGSIGSFDTVVRALANASGAIVVSVGYRLAPEHPFPAGLDDALAAVRWIAANASELGGDPDRLAIAGDSAGGNLATVVARRLRGEVTLRLQALIYPVTDAALSTPSYREFGERNGLTAASMQRFWNLYLDGADGLHPDASPLRAEDLDGMPPAYVLTAERDPLRDEGEAYADRLRAAGVEVASERFAGTIHGFFRWLAATGEAHRAVGEVGAALRAALA
ncbi:MAG: acetyl esterase, partial [Solirubrobacteraceae bacterium]|nr:acetyl esterase [Solirubrobacteraceae bacterium]